MHSAARRDLDFATEVSLVHCLTKNPKPGVQEGKREECNKQGILTAFNRLDARLCGYMQQSWRTPGLIANHLPLRRSKGQKIARKEVGITIKLSIYTYK
jgi:hypothetical protein